MNIPREQHLNLLAQHYDATFVAVSDIWSQRNRAALYLYVLSLALLVPELQNSLLEKLLGEKAQLPTQEMLSILGLVVLLAILTLLTQRTRYLDSAYIYLEGIEERMELLAGHPLISREGKYYRRNFKGVILPQVQ